MSRVDWIALAIAGLGALSGLRRGLVATALSFGGLIAGALVGARIAPHLLHGGAGAARRRGGFSARWPASIRSRRSRAGRGPRRRLTAGCSRRPRSAGRERASCV